MAEDAAGSTGGDDARSTPDLAEETRRIVGAVQDWMQRTVPESHGGPDCQWCPICQFAGVLRGERPEVAEKLALAGAAVAEALKSIVELATAPPSRAGGHPRPMRERPRPRPRPRPRVERIDLDEPDGTP